MAFRHFLEKAEWRNDAFRHSPQHSATFRLSAFSRTRFRSMSAPSSNLHAPLKILQSAVNLFPPPKKNRLKKIPCLMYTVVGLLCFIKNLKIKYLIAKYSFQSLRSVVSAVLVDDIVDHQSIKNDKSNKKYGNKQRKSNSNSAIKTLCGMTDMMIIFMIVFNSCNTPLTPHHNYYISM